MALNEKIYYSVYTINEKIWIRADVCEASDGCLVFSDIAEDGVKVTTAAFQKGYWLYCYEADAETGESIPEAIPFWKRHPKQDQNRHDSRSEPRVDRSDGFNSDTHRKRT